MGDVDGNALGKAEGNGNGCGVASPSVAVGCAVGCGNRGKAVVGLPLMVGNVGLLDGWGNVGLLVGRVGDGCWEGLGMCIRQDSTRTTNSPC